MSDISAQGEDPHAFLEELRCAVRVFQESLDKIGKLALKDHSIASGENREPFDNSGVVKFAASNITLEALDGDRGSQLRDDGGPDWDHWLPPDLHKKYTDRLDKHESECKKLVTELEHFEKHIESAGGDEAVARESEAVREKLSKVAEPVRDLLNLGKRVDLSVAMDSVYGAFKYLSDSVDKFHTSVYQQRHAFYFRRISEWKEKCEDGRRKIFGYIWNAEGARSCLELMCEKLFPDLEESMTDVAKELQSFGEKSLPMFLSDEKERATTRYLNITTIATFFSSVTATTLQISLTYPDRPFYSVVNFFWFLSLVFSVSSGVSSLIGMTWRKSSIYHTAKPPRTIGMWLDKAPMIFLIIAAMTFIVGLNTFAYLSSQVRYVSLSTNAFTGAHSVCLFVVVAWFIFRLKYESRPIKWMRGKYDRWVYAPYNSDRGLHFRRNVCWAFELDSRVLELTYKIYSDRNWPSPNVVAKVIRFVVHALKTPVRVTVASIKWIVRRMRRNSNDSTADEEEKALGEYRRKLEESFGSSERIDNVMGDVRRWTYGLGSDVGLKRVLDRQLWGYPKLASYPFSSELAGPRKRKLEELEERWRKEDAPPPQPNVQQEINAQESSNPAPSPPLSSKTSSSPDLEPGLGETGHSDSLSSVKCDLELQLSTSRPGTSRPSCSGDQAEQDPEEAHIIQVADHKGVHSDSSQTASQGASSSQAHPVDNLDGGHRDSGSAEHVITNS